MQLHCPKCDSSRFMALSVNTGKWSVDASGLSTDEAIITETVLSPKTALTYHCAECNTLAQCSDDLSIREEGVVQWALDMKYCREASIPLFQALVRKLAISCGIEIIGCDDTVDVTACYRRPWISGTPVGPVGEQWTVWELCGHCGTESALKAAPYLQKCSGCGAWIQPCAMCDPDRSDCNKCTITERMTELA